MKGFLQRWLINTLAVLVAVYVVPGMRYDKPLDLLVASLLLGILNAFLRPLLVFLSLPLLVVTFGLFWFVINALLVYLVGYLLNGFYVDSFWAAFWGGLLISLVSLAVHSLTGAGDSRVTIHRGRPSSRNRRDGDGHGPVIDV